MVNKVTAYAICSIPQCFLKSPCKSCAREYPDYQCALVHGCLWERALQCSCLLMLRSIDVIWLRNFLRWLELLLYIWTPFLTIKVEKALWHMVMVHLSTAATSSEAEPNIATWRLSLDQKSPDVLKCQCLGLDIWRWPLLLCFIYVFIYFEEERKDFMVFKMSRMVYLRYSFRGACTLSL